MKERYRPVWQHDFRELIVFSWQQFVFFTPLPVGILSGHTNGNPLELKRGMCHTETYELWLLPPRFQAMEASKAANMLAKQRVAGSPKIQPLW